MSIKQWPEQDRPREKLLRDGAETLTDAELTAIFLRAGYQGKSAVDIARELLAEHGNLRNLLNAPKHRLLACKGIGPANYAQLQAALELTKRYLHEPLRRGDALTGPEDAGDFFVHWLRDETAEIFACLFLDQRHRPIHHEKLFRGTIDAAAVYPREIVKACLHHNAAAVIVAHNHPSGETDPSAADRHLTQRLQQSLALIHVRLLDHIIVGDNKFFSFASSGLL